MSHEGDAASVESPRENCVKHRLAWNASGRVFKSWRTSGDTSAHQLLPPLGLCAPKLGELRPGAAAPVPGDRKRGGALGLSARGAMPGARSSGARYAGVPPAARSRSALTMAANSSMVKAGLDAEPPAPRWPGTGLSPRALPAALASRWRCKAAVLARADVAVTEYDKDFFSIGGCAPSGAGDGSRVVTAGDVSPPGGGTAAGLREPPPTVRGRIPPCFRLRKWIAPSATPVALERGDLRGSPRRCPFNFNRNLIEKGTAALQTRPRVDGNRRG